MHPCFPVLDGPAFFDELARAYSAGDCGLAPEWLGLFFAVLACGALQRPKAPAPPPDAAWSDVHFAAKAVEYLAPIPDAPSLDHARAFFLMSVFAFESNAKTVGSVYLATAVRVAQELELHIETPSSPHTEREPRRRLWWSLYMWDR